MKYIFLILLFLAFASPGYAEDSAAGSRAGLLQRLKAARENDENVTASATQTKSVTGTSGGRDYIVHLPPGFSTVRTYPLVIALHGGGGRADHLERHLDFDLAAEKHGYIVVYPNGEPGKRRIAQNMRTWNGGGCCGYAVESNADDVGYLDGLIRDIESKYPIDISRLYMTGHSNGAIMTYRYACERPGVLRAIAPLAGALMVPQCDARGLKVLHVHGRNDENILFDGGYGEKSIVKVDFPSVAETQKRMVDAGADFTLIAVNSDHAVRDMDAAFQKEQGQTLGEAIATFFDQAK